MSSTITLAPLTTSTTSSSSSTTTSSTSSQCIGPPWICGFNFNPLTGPPAFVTASRQYESDKAAQSSSIASQFSAYSSSQYGVLASAVGASSASAILSSVGAELSTLSTGVIPLITIPAPTSTAPTTSATTTSSSNDGSSSTLSAAAAAGIGVAGFAVCLVILLLGFFLWRRHKQKGNGHRLAAELGTPGKADPSASGSSVPSSDVPNQSMSELESGRRKHSGTRGDYPPTISTGVSAMDRSDPSSGDSARGVRYPETPVSPLTPATARFGRRDSRYDREPTPEMPRLGGLVTQVTGVSRGMETRPQSAQLLDGRPLNEMPTERQYAELKAVRDISGVHPAHKDALEEN